MYFLKTIMERKCEADENVEERNQSVGRLGVAVSLALFDRVGVK